MDGKQVRAWEEQIEEILREGLDEDFPLPGETLHLMAKAAVAVLEASGHVKQKRPRK